MIKNVKVRVLALIIASVMLGGALMVAAIMGSPYEILKKAVLDALTYRNVTTESQFTVRINGEIYEERKLYNINSDNSFLSYDYDENGNPENFRYSNKTLEIYRNYVDDDGTLWYMATVRPDYGYNNVYTGDGLFNTLNPEERDSAMMRFLEMVADALVGNLKNNITMSTDGGVRHIQGTLTESQVPEIIKAGIDVLIEQSGNNWRYSDREYDFDGQNYLYENSRIYGKTKTAYVYKQPVRIMTDYEMETWDFKEQWGTSYIGGYTYVNTAPNELVNEYTGPVTREDFEDMGDPFDFPIESLTINYLHGEAKVDDNGNLLSFDVNATVTIVNIFGEINVVELSGNERFTDIGTSKAVCPIPGAEQLLTPEYIADNFGINYNYGAVYFTLNEDGSIDINSVTTTYPGQWDRERYFEE